MENNKKLILILVIFAVVLVGAYLLYSQMAPQFAQDQLATVGTQPQETTQISNPETLCIIFHNGRTFALDKWNVVTYNNVNH